MRTVKQQACLQGILEYPYWHSPLGPDRFDWIAPKYDIGYELLRGVPVLRYGPKPVVDSIDYISNAAISEIWYWTTSLNYRVLFFGTGTTDVRADNVIKVEVLIAAEQSLGSEATGTLGALTLAELAAFWVDPDKTAFAQLMLQLPETATRRSAAGFQLNARKHGYVL